MTPTVEILQVPPYITVKAMLFYFGINQLHARELIKAGKISGSRPTARKGTKSKAYVVNSASVVAYLKDTVMK